MRYLILMSPTATGWSAHVPDLPGCIAAGETREETLELMRGAIEMHLDGMREDGELIPVPTTSPEFLDVAIAS